MCLDRECVEFPIAGWFKVKFCDFYNLKLEEVMGNLTCGDKQIFAYGDLARTGEGWNWGN